MRQTAGCASVLTSWRSVKSPSIPMRPASRTTVWFAPQLSRADRIGVNELRGALICPPIPPVNVLGIFGSAPRWTRSCLTLGRARRCADRGGRRPRRRQSGARACHVNRFFDGSDRQRDVTSNGRTRLGPEDVLHRGEAGKFSDQFVVTRRQILERERAAAIGNPLCELPVPICVNLTDAPGNRPPNGS